MHNAKINEYAHPNITEKTEPRVAGYFEYEPKTKSTMQPGRSEQRHPGMTDASAGAPTQQNGNSLDLKQPPQPLASTLGGLPEDLRSSSLEKAKRQAMARSSLDA